MKRIILAVILALAGTFVLVGCASDLGFLPITQDQAEEQIADAQELQMRALEEAQEGDLLTAGLLYIISTISGVSGAIGLSKKRRNSVDENMKRLEALKAAEAAKEAIDKKA